MGLHPSRRGEGAAPQDEGCLLANSQKATAAMTSSKLNTIHDGGRYFEAHRADWRSVIRRLV